MLELKPDIRKETVKKKIISFKVSKEGIKFSKKNSFTIDSKWFHVQNSSTSIFLPLNGCPRVITNQIEAAK